MAVILVSTGSDCGSMQLIFLTGNLPETKDKQYGTIESLCCLPDLDDGAFGNGSSG